MDLVVFDLKWSRAKDGYQIEKRDQRALKLLTGEERKVEMMVMTKPSGRIEKYSPIESTPSIHRIFSEQVRDGDSAIAFANQFGLLKSERSEPLQEFIDNAASVRSALARIESWARLPAKEKDEKRPALAEVINSYGFATTELRLRHDSTTGTFKVQCTPRTLLGLIWLKVLQILTDEVEPVPCGNPKCKEVIERNRDGRTQRRQFCSNTCAQAVKRMRDKKSNKEK